MLKTRTQDSIGRTHANAGTHKDVGIKDYSHGGMVSEMPPITIMRVLSNKGLLQAIQGAAEGLRETKPCSRKIV
jgi:hypothetical protein